MVFESYIDRFAYNQNNGHSIQIAGWCFSQSFCAYKLVINKKEVPFILKETSRQELLTRFSSGIVGNGKGFLISYQTQEPIQSVTLYAICEGESSPICHYNEKRLRSVVHLVPVDFEIDSYILQKDKITLTGWAAAFSKKDIDIRVNGKYSIERFARRDLVVLNIIDEEQAFCGFKIEMERVSNPQIIFVEDEEYCVPLKKEWITENQNLVISSLTHRNMDRAIHVLLEKGPKKLMDKVLKKNVNYESLYHELALKKDVDSNTLQQQKNTKFEYNPKMSIVVATFNTPIEYLKKMMDTVFEQSYSNWELCIADGSKDTSVLDYIDAHYKDERVKTVKLDKNYGISGNMNAAIEIATGDYIGLYDHDDELTLDALYEFVKAINDNPKLKVIYSDEDKINSEGTYRFEPSFKPDFNIDFLRSYNYICHLLFVKKSHLYEVGLLKEEYDGAQDHDFVLRCTECLRPDEIHHIAKVLYHWRIHQNSTAGNAQSKLYAFDAGVRSVSDHYKRVGIDASVKHGSSLGCYVSTYKLHSTPLVSVIVKNASSICLESIQKSSYTNKEIVESVEMAKGDFYLFLDKDMEMTTNTWIEELLGFFEREDVGVVGGRFYYPDQRIAHAGIIVGGSKGYFKAFENFPKGSSGYACRLFSCMDLSAISPNCMMTRKELFDGFDDSMSFECAGVDYCLRTIQKGYKVIYNPYCEGVYHGMDEQVCSQGFIDKWKDYIDPFYNLNLTLEKSDFSFKE